MMMKNIINNQLNRILLIVDLYDESKKLDIKYLKQKGDKRCKDSRKICTNKYAKNPKHYKIEGPALFLISKQLEWLITNFIILDSDMKEVKPTKFVVKYPENWISIFRQDSMGVHNYSGFCNCRCDFCYEVDGLLDFERNLVSINEIETRIKHYDFRKYRGFPSPLSHYKEPFFNIHFIEILKKMRIAGYVDEFEFSTNGCFLTKDTVEELKKLKPISFHISLNSCYTKVRRKYMKDDNPNIALESLKLLMEAKIRFEISIVAWPEIGLGDLVDTILFADKWNPLTIVVHLPGYTRFHKKSKITNNFKEHWDSTVDRILELRLKTQTPIKIFPSLYYQKSLEAKIDGICNNSPAYYAGLKIGDEISQINGKHILSKSHANSLLETDSNNEVNLVYYRNDEKYETSIRHYTDEEDRYPFKPIGYAPAKYPYGIYLNQDIKPEYIGRLVNITLEQAYKSILLVSSDLLMPKVKEFLEENEIDIYTEKFDIIPVENIFFGGNIMLGDLAVIDDYSYTINKFIKENYKPDLIVIPSSFLLGNEFDLIGSSFSKLERELKISIKLLYCNNIFD